MPTLKLNSEAEWLAAREATIGGSEIAGLFTSWRMPDGQAVVLHAYEAAPEGAACLGSCSPYHTPYGLWAAKSGLVQPDDFSPNERMQAGTYLEPAIAEWAKAKWEMKLRKVRRYHLHPLIGGWGASVDFEEVAPGMPPVEIKNVDGLIARDRWVIEGQEIIASPLHITLQLQHYIGARGASGGWLVACVGGNELARGWFDLHEPTQIRIAEAIAAFWQGVRDGVAPSAHADGAAVAERFAYGDTGAVADLTGDREAATIAARYTRWRAHAGRVEAALDNLKGRLADRIGPATRAKGDGFTVSWPVIERPEKVIPERVQSAKVYRGGFTVRQSKGA